MKQQITSFKILNDSNESMTIIHEPECFEFELPKQEEVVIQTDSCLDTVTLRYSVENGKVIVSVLDENSLYNVFYKGDDVFRKYK